MKPLRWGRNNINAIEAVWCFRFQFAKAVLTKMKGKFQLDDIFATRPTSLQRTVKTVLLQYLAVPLLRPSERLDESSATSGSSSGEYA